MDQGSEYVKLLKAHSSESTLTRFRGRLSPPSKRALINFHSGYIECGRLPRKEASSAQGRVKLSPPPGPVHTPFRGGMHKPLVPGHVNTRQPALKIIFDSHTIFKLFNQGKKKGGGGNK